jgi:hypothetical protein
MQGLKVSGASYQEDGGQFEAMPDCRPSYRGAVVLGRNPVGVSTLGAFVVGLSPDKHAKEVRHGRMVPARCIQRSC